MTLKVNIEQLQAFCATADTGSFSAAGRLLGKSQSAVSTQVMQLEEIIDYQLFERGYKPKLTKRGELLLRQADRIIRQLSSFERHAYILHSSQHTIFRIGIDYSIYLIKFFDLFSKFSNKYPTLEVQITQLPPSDICKFMRESRLDMALCFSDKSNFEFNCKQLGTYTNHLVVSKNHPLARKKRVTFSDLQDYRHIVVCSPYDKPEDIHSLSPYHYEVNSYLYAFMAKT